MNTISECQTLDITNLITYRGKVKQKELSGVMLRMKNYAEGQGAKVVGGPISVTHGVAQTEAGELADTEIMLPVDKRISETKEFTWKDRLLLANAVKLNYTGSPTMFPNSCNELNAYILEKRHTPITAGYIVNRGIDELSGMVNMEVYIGINPNIV